MEATLALKAVGWKGEGWEEDGGEEEREEEGVSDASRSILICSWSARKRESEGGKTKTSWNVPSWLSQRSAASTLRGAAKEKRDEGGVSFRRTTKGKRKQIETNSRCWALYIKKPKQEVVSSIFFWDR